VLSLRRLSPANREKARVLGVFYDALPGFIYHPLPYRQSDRDRTSERFSAAERPGYGR
jgi:hypothetical protein